MSFVLSRQTSTVDYCFHVNNSLNEICASYKVIMSLQKNCFIHMDFFYNRFINFLKHQSFVGIDSQWRVEKIQQKYLHLCFKDEQTSGITEGE